MDIMQAFMMGEMCRGLEQKVFDWDKAAQILKERKAADAQAGLDEDWDWTCGTILYDGKPVADHPFLASTWATPVLELDGAFIECWRMASEVPAWNAGTVWPQSALDILGWEGEPLTRDMVED